MPLGDWATWVQSAATVGALIAAVVAAVVAQKVYGIESARDERAAEERRARSETERRAQADRIAAWYTHWPPKARDYGRARVHGAIVKNSSDLPLFDVSVTFWLPWEHPNADRPPENITAAPLIRVVPPRSELRTDDDLFMERGLAGGPGNGEHYQVSFEFRDAAGIRWRRDVNGKLTELHARSDA